MKGRSQLKKTIVTEQVTATVTETTFITLNHLKQLNIL